MQQSLSVVFVYIFGVCGSADNNAGIIRNALSEIDDPSTSLGCIVPDQCPPDRTCVSGVCRDPCENLCGANTICAVVKHIPTCACKEGHTGNPFTGCYRNEDECTGHDNCPPHMACVSHRCADPCTGLCGSNTLCKVTYHLPSCACKEGYTGNPFTECKQNDKGDLKLPVDGCIGHEHCLPQQVCVDYTCADPCTGLCGNNTLCKVTDHVPACVCKEGYTGDPFKECNTEVCLGKWPPVNAGEKAYFIEDEVGLSWLEAVDRCANQGMHILRIENAKEMESVRKLIRGYDFHLWWIDGRDTKQEGQFVWTGGEPVPFANWDKGEPNDKNSSEDCMMVTLKGREKRLVWNDMPCSDTLTYICEFYE